MEAVKFYNLADVDDLVESFLKDNSDSIRKHWQNKNNTDGLAYEAFLTELQPKLKTACVTFLNSNVDLSVLNSYLFPVILTAVKKDSMELVKKITVPICPAHKFLGIEHVVTGNKIFKCSLCEEQLATADSGKWKLFSMFALHNQQGYKCLDCERFIPQPLDSLREMVCPYFDCYFVGNIAQLPKLKHPTITKIVQQSSLDETLTGSTFTRKDSLISNNPIQDQELEIKEAENNNILLLKDIIESQSNSLYYSSSNATLIHYLKMYEAFGVLLDRQPKEMISYLINLHKNEGLQHKIFQEYISLLEKSLPFGFKKGGENYKIISLLDENLCLFDGISNFSTVVNEKKEIKNGTTEFYIGGRSSSYSKPYYMGKLLSLITNDGISIMDDVLEYSFSKIKLKNTLPGTKVQVSHLRIPPHYQMGGMNYLNKTRKKIVDKAYLTINGSKRPTKK